ncbi:alpha/beta hydrolase [Kutzneria viridogrisea]|nr:alpha/beta fold hydrolase [Kutzneria albida]
MLAVAVSALAACLLVPPVSGAATPRLVWSPCTGSLSTLECGSLAVPLDHLHPDGEKIAVAVSRRRAADPQHRRGVLLINPGGPGGSGLSMPRYVADHTPLGQYYDLVGFDPRGVGASTALNCLRSPTLADTDSRPADAEFASWTAQARADEDACQRAGGGIRPFVTTANTARDMDLLRAALGEEKINYLGYSYGTYLGAVYGTLFPQRLNLSVLDSSVHPEWLWRKQFLEQAAAYRADVDAWADWVGHRDNAYGLGTSSGAVLSTVERLAGRLAKSPVGEFTRSMLDGALGQGARYRPLWSDLAVLVGRISRGQAPDPGVLDATRAGRALAEAGIHELRSGVFDTVTCEADWPTDPETYYQDMRTYRDRFPYGYGVSRAAPTGCTFRSFTPADHPVRLARTGYPVGVVVQAEADAQTQYAGGPAMANLLRDNLITVTDEGRHGEYGSNPCVNERINRYFVDGVLPDSRSVCAGDPRPGTAADPAVPPAAVAPARAASLTDSVRTYLSALPPI